MNTDDLQTRFDHHPPADGRTALLHDNVRAWLLGVATDIVNHTPASREQSLAITKLEEAMFWANAAIARHSGGES